VAPPPAWHARAARWVRPAAWAAGLLPLAWLVAKAFTSGLGAEPIEAVTLHTGFWGLVLLLCSLAVTPVRRWTGWNWLAPVRRTLGLCAFFTIAAHFLVYLVDQGFSPGFIVEDIVDHPYVTVGFAAFLILLALALTSTKAAIRRMGKRWQKLHRLVYLAGGLGVLHFLWLVKKDLRDPLIFAAVFALLMGIRLLWALRAKPRPARAGGRTAGAP
jgi:methionine sulfoxide reductase heme-binding subunit